MNLLRTVAAHAETQRILLTLHLLLDRRAVTFVVVDALMLILATTAALLGEGTAGGMYVGVILVPFIAIAIPILADTVSLERRAGSIDLALSSPGGSHYFTRRIGAFCGLMFLQGIVALLFSRFMVEEFPLVPAVIQLVITCALIGATTLYWSLRLRTAGGVLFASVLTVGALGKWVFSIPVYPRWNQVSPIEVLIPWARQNVVLLIATGLLYLYARRRLTRPEEILQ